MGIAQKSIDLPARDTGNGRDRSNLTTGEDVVVMQRRSFLARTSAFAAASLAGRPSRSGTFESRDLVASSTDVQIAPEGYPATRVWSYDAMVPGPEIRLAQGARLKRRLVNTLDEPTSVHWHGIRIDNAMDGVPGVTQDAVRPGDSFLYDFHLPDAGTYWYHSHNKSYEQVARGLYGPLIVEEAQPPDVDREEVLVLDDFRLDPDSVRIAGFRNMHDFSHGGRIGNITVTSGVFNKSLAVRQNERLRLRLINAANARIFELGLQGLVGWIVALDGMPLPEPEAVTNRLVLAPAQRVDLIADVVAERGEEAHLVRYDGNEGFSQVLFEVGDPVSATRRAMPPPLPPNPDMAINGLDNALRTSLHMEGGAMRGFPSARMDGRAVGFREAAQEMKFWALNGVIGMPEEPLLTAGRGQTVRVRFRNETAFPHAMHLHGHHFRELGPEDRLGPFRDTLLVHADETREIAFVAHNPGDWVFHCHMLTHAASGMMTWIRVQS